MLQLIGKEETTDVTFDGTTFKVRVRAGTWWEDIRVLNRGKDPEEHRKAMLCGIIEGWENLLDAKGKPVEFHADLVLAVWDALPEDCVSAIWAKAKGRQRAYADALGNSEPSSGSDA